MLVRLRDFAELYRISERTVQVHIKNNLEELEGHIDRRGKQGTWLDEFAVNFLLDRIQLPTKDEVLVPTPREAALLEQLSAANRMLADAERRAGENAEAAGKVRFLEAAQEAQNARIHDLSVEVGQWTQKTTDAEKRAQKAEDELEAAQDKLNTAQEKIQQYKEAVAAYNALPGWRRAFTKAPVLVEE